MVTATVTTIKTKTAFPLKPLPAMIKPSPVQLQTLVNPLTKVSLPGTTIPKTKVVVPLETKGIVESVQAIGAEGLKNPLAFINPFGAASMFGAALYGVLNPAKTAITPKTGVNMLRKTRTQAEIASDALAAQVKLGQWYKLKSPTLIPTITMMKTKSVFGALSAGGYEVNVKGTQDILTQFRDMLNLKEADIEAQKGAYELLFGKYKSETEAQTKYIGELSTALQTLQEGSLEAGVWKAKYEATWKQLQDLLSGGGNGGGNGNGTAGTDWKSLLLYGALAIGGIIVLWALLKGRGK